LDRRPEITCRHAATKRAADAADAKGVPGSQLSRIDQKALVTEPLVERFEPAGKPNWERKGDDDRGLHKRVDDRLQPLRRQPFRQDRQISAVAGEPRRGATLAG
jgi:hypothetical protein